MQDQTDTLSRRSLRSLPHCTSSPRPRHPSSAEMLGEKAPRSHARHGLLGRTRTHKDPLAKCGKGGGWRLLHTSSVCKGLDGTRALPESPHVMHIFYAVGLAERMHFESHDTLIEGLRLHPEANGYTKRLLADLQTLAFVPEWAEQVANVELEFGDVFRLGSKLNEWFLSLDLRQFRAAFFTQTVAPCRVDLSDDEGDDDLEGENENCICTLLDEDGWECGRRWPTARALAAHQLHTQGRTHGEPKGVASLVVTNQCFWCGSTHASIETTSKHMAAAEKTQQMRG